MPQQAGFAPQEVTIATRLKDRWLPLRLAFCSNLKNQVRPQRRSDAKIIRRKPIKIDFSFWPDGRVGDAYHPRPPGMLDHTGGAGDRRSLSARIRAL